MKNPSIALLVAFTLIGCASKPATEQVIPSLLINPNTQKSNQPLSPDAYVDGVGMLHFKEYHTKISHQDRWYLLDSYVIPLEQPFYVHVRATDDTPIMKETAVSVAMDYITPRGCTEPPIRRPELDKTTNDQSEWIIGVAC